MSNTIIVNTHTIVKKKHPLSGCSFIDFSIISFQKNPHQRYRLHFFLFFIIVSEGISLRGHSGRPADMISRKLTAAGILNRTAFPEHTQRAGDTTAADRLLATRFADCALNAIANNETYVMTALIGDECRTVTLSDFINAGEVVHDPKIPDLMTSNAYVSPNDPLLDVAYNMGIYLGESK